MKTVILPAILFIFLCVAIVTPLYSVDFGGRIDNSTSIDTEAPVFGQQDTLGLWFTTGASNPLIFTAGGSYTFSLTRPYLFNLDDFKLQGNLLTHRANPSKFSFELGRCRFTDFSGEVLSHTVDGFTAGFTYPFAAVKVAFGYTGLVFKPLSSIIISKGDSNDKDIDTVILGSKRLIGTFLVNFPTLFRRQNLSLSILFQEDLRKLLAPAETLNEGDSVFSPEKGSTVDTQYAGLGLSGPIAAGLFYNVFGYFGTGRTLSYIDNDSSYQNTWIFSFLAGGGLRYYLEKFLFSRIAVRFLYASGDGDSRTFLEGNSAGNSTTFTPISGSATGLIFSPVTGNIFYGNISYSIKPFSFLKSEVLKSIQTQVDFYSFFRSTPGPISEPGINPQTTSLYLGSEIDGVINFRPVSDLGSSISLGFFLPSKQTFLEEKNKPVFLGRFDFSFSF
ncbi:MAG: hypothetical protein AB1798_17135 [Spirochaetota bacterium]